ncbi:hypothetical protein [Mycolicibacter virginiensis]|uniref:hypothetical protein n=1 Tax=Mycolicibacter virginiensis TaxID=1795032 RepID=UPI001F045282|nr:hypothetical protein [Mycolicibacter virginiensis]ULP49383.1 hypothetical protein MJO54_10235 [Mycolicibacter virginiensis]
MADLADVSAGLPVVAGGAGLSRGVSGAAVACGAACTGRTASALSAIAAAGAGAARAASMTHAQMRAEIVVAELTRRGVLSG